MRKMIGTIVIVGVGGFALYEFVIKPKLAKPVALPGSNQPRDPVYGALTNAAKDAHAVNDLLSQLGSIGGDVSNIWGKITAGSSGAGQNIPAATPADQAPTGNLEI